MFVQFFQFHCDNLEKGGCPQRRYLRRTYRIRCLETKQRYAERKNIFVSLLSDYRFRNQSRDIFQYDRSSSSSTTIIHLSVRNYNLLEEGQLTLSVWGYNIYPGMSYTIMSYLALNELTVSQWNIFVSKFLMHLTIVVC